MYSVAHLSRQDPAATHLTQHSKVPTTLPCEVPRSWKPFYLITEACRPAYLQRLQRLGIHHTAMQAKVTLQGQQVAGQARQTAVCCISELDHCPRTTHLLGGGAGGPCRPRQPCRYCPEKTNSELALTRYSSMFAASLMCTTWVHS